MVETCGIYKNLNKMTKNSQMHLKFNKLLIFVILYRLRCKIEGHAVLKVFLYRKTKGKTSARKSKEIASLIKIPSTLKFILLLQQKRSPKETRTHTRRVTNGIIYHFKAGEFAELRI